MAPDTRREDDLFFAALAMEADRRAAFVLCEAGGNEELAERVLALLRAEDEAQAVGFMAQPAWQALADGREEGVPRRIGRYEILAVLGRGGMGVVFHARDGATGTEVAIKTLPPLHDLDPQARQRFAREIAALGRLDDVHIVRALDAREIQGVHLLVMEYVPGRNLADLVAQDGPLGIAEACRLAAGAARGLHHAHERGVVHRDLKPANIIRTPEGEAKLLDLGLALINDSLSQERLTATGSGLGTPDYLAPEQIDAGHRADRRADLYGLGCTLHFLLAGAPPFHRHASHAAKIRAHQTETPPRLQRRDVPPALIELLQDLLAKSPADRPATALEAAERLERIAAGTAGKGSVPSLVGFFGSPVACFAYLLVATLILGARLLALLLRPDGTAMLLELDQFRLRLEIAVFCCTLVGALYLGLGPLLRKRHRLRLALTLLLVPLLVGAVICDWGKLLAGARPAARAATARPVLGRAHVRAAITRHQAGLSDKKKASFGYLSLTHLHDRATVPAAALDEWRAALREWADRMAPGLKPEAIDAERTIYAVDLGNVRGLRQKWQDNTVPGHPYGVVPAQERSKALEAELRGDWVVASARLAVPVAASYSEAVDLDCAATELGCTPADLRRTLAGPLPDGLAGLRGLAEGGKVERGYWAGAVEGLSRFQMIAQHMGLGEPVIH